MSELEGNPAEVVDEIMDQPDAGSSEGFFEALEKDVNGVIADNDTEATQQSIGPEQVTQSQYVGSDNVAAQEGSSNWENATKIVAEKLSSGEMRIRKLKLSYQFSTQ